MSFGRKLKSPVLSTEAIIGIVALTSFFFLLIFSFRLAIGFGSLITIFAAMLSLVILIRTGNPYYIVTVVAQLAGTCLLLMITLLDIVDYKPYFIAVAGLMVVFMTLMLIFILQRKMKWRTREVLEMAASPVNESNNGFTNRPLQVGKANYSLAELKAFSSFLRKNLIAIPVKESDRIVFVVNMPLGRVLLFNRRYRDRSWVSFDHEGNVIAHITQEDYFLFKDQLTFDQLCESLGKQFIRFFQDHNSGAGQKIIEQFDAMKLNIITEG
ncbi:MAG: hypothetical protein ABFS05_02820 [Bacteroidota bacterium]